MLLSLNNKAYSFNVKDHQHATNMTSNTTPPPYITAASSVYTNGASYAAWRAFNDTANCWYAEKLPQWIQLNISKKIAINKVRIKSGENRVSETPKEFSILGSNDGTNFETIASYSLESWDSLTWKEFEFNISEYSIYRIHVTAYFGTTNVRVAINQIIFGFYESSLIEIDRVRDQNFNEYGQKSLQDLNSPMKNKIHILQNTDPETDLARVQLTKKPLNLLMK